MEVIKQHQNGSATAIWVKLESGEEILVFDDLTVFSDKNPPRASSKIIFRNDEIKFINSIPHISRDYSVKEHCIHHDFPPFARLQADEWGWKAAFMLTKFLDDTLMARIES